MSFFMEYLQTIFCGDFFASSNNLTPDVVTTSTESIRVLPNFHDVYELGDVIGEGGNAVVRIGSNLQSSEKVAVKIAKRAELDPRRESALKREFDILRSLQHPHIVGAVGLFEEDQNYYVVLEYMKGGELFDRIVTKTQYSEKEARDAVRCILNAVEYLHSHGVVHRDLKPENLLLANENDDTSIKVADFGLARTIDGNVVMSKAGTPEYWAPEVLESKLCGKPVDMWAVGVITYVLLGGYAPFHSRQREKLFENIRRAEVKFHPKRWSAVSEEAKSFIRGLLLYDPDKRMTATAALSHSWIACHDHILADQDLLPNLEELKKYNSSRRFRTGVKVLTALSKFKLKLNKSKNAQGIGEVEAEEDHSAAESTDRSQSDENQDA